MTLKLLDILKEEDILKPRRLKDRDDRNPDKRSKAVNAVTKVVGKELPNKYWGWISGGDYDYKEAVYYIPDNYFDSSEKLFDFIKLEILLYTKLKKEIPDLIEFIEYSVDWENASDELRKWYEDVWYYGDYMYYKNEKDINRIIKSIKEGVKIYNKIK